MPRPAAEIGEIIAALARAGVFRLRGVLVGTIAYQTYAAMLGLRLPSASTITMDIDIAQFTNVSIAIGDRTAPVLEVLKKVNKSFRPASNVVDGRRATSYSATGGLRVDFLTPDDHTKTGRPRKLPALQTDAQPLHFLDFLIRDPEPAVVLHGAGIYVHVPAPARYAVHKLIISRRRPEGFAKRDKDLHQAEVLLAALAEKRPHDLKSAWEEAYECGPKWRQLMIEGLGLLEPLARDVVLDNIGAPRSILPGIDLSFDNPPARYDFSRDIVTFVGKALGSSVNCAISREALDDHFGSDGLGQEGRLEAFLKNKSRIEAIARAKYLSAPVEEPGSLLIRTTFLTTRFGE
nr:GSU2403 family nucleotidyltransferase fold protein [Bradyrhizobium pachyrhizi]